MFAVSPPDTLPDTAAPPQKSDAARQHREERLHALDGLRGVAALMVLITHYVTVTMPWPTRLEWLGKPINDFFASGVELFFVLSGLIMVYPYLARGKELKAAEYFKRRWTRLWPPYLVSWFLCGVATYIGTAIRSPYAKEALEEFDGWSWLSQMFVFSSWDRYNSTWWSLNIELFFYALVPLFLMLGIGRLNLPAFWFLFAASALVSFAIYEPDMMIWRVTLLGTAPLFLWYAPCFLIGIGVSKFRFKSRRLAMTFIAAGVGVILASALFPQINFHTGYAFFFGGWTMLALQETALSRFLSQRRWVWLGERSYSLFLIHVPVLYLISIFATALTTQKVSVTYIAITRGLGIPLSFLGAMLLFHYVERHFARNLATADQFWPWSPTTRPAEGR